MKVELGKVYEGRDGERREVVAISGDMVSYVESRPRQKRPLPPQHEPAESFLRWAESVGAIESPAGATADAPPTPEDTPAVGSPTSPTDALEAPSDVVAGESPETPTDTPRKRRRFPTP